MDYDPTLLSCANWKYNNAVKSLLFALSCVGLSSAELQTFQSEYKRSAFICTVRNCERSRFGYPSAVELEDHKTRQHTTGFKCYYQNCRYNDIGFTSSRSLRAHEKRFHLRDLPTIPQTLKRKYMADSPTENTGATAPVPQQAAPMVPPADPNQNQRLLDLAMPVSNLEGGLTSPYCYRLLLTSDVSQEFGFDFDNPPANNYVLNNFDYDSFLHDKEDETSGFD